MQTQSDGFPTVTVNDYLPSYIPKNSVILNATANEQPSLYNVLLDKYYWLARDIKSPINTYSGSTNRLVESWAWTESPIPRWNDYFAKIINYESYYSLRSSDMYQAYKDNRLNEYKIPSDVTAEWVRLYRLYFL